MKKLIVSLKQYWEITIVTISGLAIRFSGAKWGFPSTLHSDESVLVRSSLGMRFGDLNPHHFDWPSFYFYINYFIYWVFLKIRVRLQVIFGTEQLELNYPFWWHHELPFYYISRILAATFSAGTIILVYWAAKILFKSKKIALISGLIYSIGYLSIYFSRYGIHDSAYTFFVFLSFIFSLKILDKDSYKNYIFAALFAGLATSVKYSGAIACIYILLAAIYKNPNIKQIILNKKLWIAAMVSLIAFYLGTPYALLDYDTFFSSSDYRGALWQIEHMGRGLNWNYHILGSIPRNYGYLGALAGYLGLFTIYRQSKKQKSILFVTSFLATLLYIGSWGITRDHYALPLLPFLAIATGYFLVHFENKFIKIKKAGIALLLLIVVQPTYGVLIDTNKRLNGDTRNIAGSWIENNLKKGENIFLQGGKTGVYGGDNPVFEWGNYNVISLDLYNKGDKGYVIYSKWKSDQEEIREECKVFQNKKYTGPIINICKL